VSLISLAREPIVLTWATYHSYVSLISFSRELHISLTWASYHSHVSYISLLREPHITVTWATYNSYGSLTSLSLEPHISLTWVSERLSAFANSTLSGVERYRWASNRFSRPVSWWSENTVLAFRRRQCFAPRSPEPPANRPPKPRPAQTRNSKHWTNLCWEEKAQRPAPLLMPKGIHSFQRYLHSDSMDNSDIF
jgi:hypothetical protein